MAAAPGLGAGDADGGGSAGNCFAGLGGGAFFVDFFAFFFFVPCFDFESAPSAFALGYHSKSPKTAPASVALPGSLWNVPVFFPNDVLLNGWVVPRLADKTTPFVRGNEVDTVRPVMAKRSPQKQQRNVKESQRLTLPGNWEDRVADSFKAPAGKAPEKPKRAYAKKAAKRKG